MNIIPGVEVVQKVIKRVPYVGPVIQGAALALDAKEILETSTPVGAAKIILGWFVEDCITSGTLT